MAGLLTDAEIASMTATVAESMDVTITLQRRTSTQDDYGHTTQTWATIDTPRVNVIKPSATILQLYADVIGSQRALVIRYMPTTDIQQNDQILYINRTWRVQEIMNAESYTVGLEALITTVV